MTLQSTQTYTARTIRKAYRIQWNLGVENMRHINCFVGGQSGSCGDGYFLCYSTLFPRRPRGLWQRAYLTQSSYHPTPSASLPQLHLSFTFDCFPFAVITVFLKFVIKKLSSASCRFKCSNVQMCGYIAYWKSFLFYLVLWVFLSWTLGFPVDQFRRQRQNSTGIGRRR